MKDSWQNNKISKKLNEEYPHDFSICDIDGICRCFYKQNNTWKQRFVIYESKEKNEEASQTQLQSLYELDKSIKWENFDEHSGVYLLKHDEDVKCIDVYKIKENGFHKYQYEKIGETTMDRFYNWVSVKDKRK
jgi:hypothetical protein